MFSSGRHRLEVISQSRPEGKEQPSSRLVLCLTCSRSANVDVRHRTWRVLIDAQVGWRPTLFLLCIITISINPMSNNASNKSPDTDKSLRETTFIHYLLYVVFYEIKRSLLNKLLFLLLSNFFNTCFFTTKFT